MLNQLLKPNIPRKGFNLKLKEQNSLYVFQIFKDTCFISVKLMRHLSTFGKYSLRTKKVKDEQKNGLIA